MEIDANMLTMKNTGQNMLSQQAGTKVNDVNLEKSSPSEHSDTSDHDTRITRIRRRIKRFSDSESDGNPEPINNVEDGNSRSSNEFVKHCKNLKSTATNQVVSDRTENDISDSEIKMQPQRTKNKRKKLTDKFKGLLNSRKKELVSDNDNKESDKSNSSEGSNDNSINEIRQKIKERNIQLKSTLWDPDTSDEEHNLSNEKTKQKPKKGVKLTSPKPIRMTAKLALENMQKIKSESNRMLREKEVSLPYHRPKALNLKDIMSRRKPALTRDGKALPIKMNQEQLKQYAKMLEERQKEMMELCKSESDEDEQEDMESKKDDECKNDGDNKDDDDKKSETDENSAEDIQTQNDLEFESVLSSTQTNIETDLNSQHKQTTELSHVPKINELMLGMESNVSDSNHNQLIEHDNGNAQIECNKNDNTDSSLNEMSLVYNDSADDLQKTNDENINEDEKTVTKEVIDKHVDDIQQKLIVESSVTNSEPESQLLALHYDTEKNTEPTEEQTVVAVAVDDKVISELDKDNESGNKDFSDDEMNMDDIDKIIENAEIIKKFEDNFNSPMLIRDPMQMKTTPILTGAPGMVIDLDGTDPMIPKKLSGVELLKERFSYFSKLKTPEEMERERERSIVPGNLHLKLKQELEDKIAEQRSLEWAKRLEDLKQNRMATDDDDDEKDILEEDDIDKIEKKLEEGEKETADQSSESEEEELLENDVELKDKPRKTNAMLDDEAEESDDVDEDDKGAENDDDENNDADLESDDDSSDSSSDEELLDDSKPKKGRILKAFEDSDDEANNQDSSSETKIVVDDKHATQSDEVIQLAQINKSYSEDLFTSQESKVTTVSSETKTQSDVIICDSEHIATQSFSILNNDSNITNDILGKDLDMETFSVISNKIEKCKEMLPLICGTQQDDLGLDAAVAMCSGSFSQNLVSSQLQTPIITESQTIGDDVLALCTGNFYDNVFVSQVDDKTDNDKGITTQEAPNNPTSTNSDDTQTVANTEIVDDTQKVNDSKTVDDGNVLKSILDELNDPDFEEPKPNKYFVGSKENDKNVMNSQLRKKFVIDSDDETNDVQDVTNNKKKKIKKRKLQERALQISDDEEDLQEDVEEEESESEIEDDTERVVEYDSEENEVQIQALQPKKKRKTAEFFEQEAELTSEDEWVGSGDEDERGLDRMEREEGDDDHFHQGALRAQLGEIHMRDVLDQDKREVRLLQELLFEDGDLGAGGRERKFKWRNNEGDEESGAVLDEFGETQDENESEEQWRKQRHEREVFLRQMRKQTEEEDTNINISRSTIIKANLSSKTMSCLLIEANVNKSEAESPAPEKKTVKDIPSAHSPLDIFQRTYHGSLLNRGQSTLARLAAIANPIATDHDTKVKLGSGKQNFVFHAVDDDEEKPKITKRKAENLGTPKLLKKMKAEKNEKPNYSRNSLLDHFKS